VSADRWWEFKPVITVCDVIDVGACYDGVIGYIETHSKLISAPCITVDHDYSVIASNRQRESYGYGDECGHRYGDGNGDGYGEAYGNIGGYGYGYVDGYGDGGCNGYGYGYGDGTGESDDYGDEEDQQRKTK
jgi:hypothetical protein